MKPAHYDLHAAIEERHWWFVGRRRILGRLVRAVAPPDRGLTIADVGCGTGANVASLGNGYRPVGIDPSPRAVASARKRFPDVRFVAGDPAGAGGAELGRASVVLLTDVLEHVEQDRSLLAGIVQRMSPGAYLLITVPARPELWSQHDVSFGHYRRYTSEGLAALWSDLPVRTRLFSYFNARLYPIAAALRRWNRLRGRASGSEGTDFTLLPAPVNSLLTTVFSGESRRLLRVLRGRGRPYRLGLSLVALLRTPDAGRAPPRGSRSR